MNLPTDNFILLSYVNTLLRDSGASLGELCTERDFSETQIRTALATIGYKYDDKTNSFKIV